MTGQLAAAIAFIMSTSGCIVAESALIYNMVATAPSTGNQPAPSAAQAGSLGASQGPGPATTVVPVLRTAVYFSTKLGGSIAFIMKGKTFLWTGDDAAAPAPAPPDKDRDKKEKP